MKCVKVSESVLIVQFYLIVVVLMYYLHLDVLSL
jgi:hypothetical protein